MADGEMAWFREKYWLYHFLDISHHHYLGLQGRALFGLAA
jgi:hypothetical protein